MPNPLREFLKAMECAESAQDVKSWLSSLGTLERRSLGACLAEAVRIHTEFEKPTFEYKGQVCDACVSARDGRYPFAECDTCDKYPRIHMASYVADNSSIIGGSQKGSYEPNS